MLEKEFQYYLTHQKELTQKYLGKFIVIKDESIIGIYGSEIEAYEESIKTNELGTFLIQEVQAGEENITQIFRSRVVFA